MNDQTVTVEIEVPQAQVDLLRETLRLSRNHHRDPLSMIRDTALIGAMGLASSTVDCRYWRQLDNLAVRLGVPALFIEDWPEDAPP